MSTLEQIEEEVAELLDRFEEPDPAEIEKLMMIAEGKRDAFGGFIIKLEDRAERLRLRVTAIELRARRFEGRVKKLKQIAASIMRHHGHTKLEGTEITMTLLEGQQRVVVDDEREVPDRFKETRTVVVKALVTDALRDGMAVPGAHLETGPDTVRVYT